MKRVALLLLAVCWALSASANDTTYKRGVGGASGSSGGFGGQTYPVAPGSLICNADCGTQTAQCAPGTPMAQAIAASSASNPVRVLVLPGVHDECVAISNNVGEVTLEISPGAVIHPTTTVTGGAVRVGNDTATLRNTGPVRIVNDGLIQNDAFSAPESALQVGPEICNGATSPTWTDVEVTGSGRYVGHHDAVQWCGDQLAASGAATKQLPRMWLHDTRMYSGRDPCTKKGNSIDVVRNVECTGWSNYCEDKSGNTHLGAVSTTATSGTTTSVVINGADKYGENGGYANRLMRLSDADGGGPGVCGAANADNGLVRASNGYAESSGTIFLASTSALPTAATSGCAVTIDAVAHVEESPCDTHWRTAFASGASLGSHWKITGFHNGLGAPAASGNSSLDSLLIEHSLLRVIVNEAVISDAPCNAIANIAGYLAYDDAQFGDVRMVQDDVEVEVNAEQELTPSCAFPIGGVKVTGTADLDAVRFSGAIRVKNAAAPTSSTAAVVVDSTTANTLTLDGVTLQMTTPGGFSATATSLVATSPDTLVVVGDIASPDLLTVSNPAQVTGWDELAVPVLDVTSVTGAITLPIQGGPPGAQIQAAACSCKGTCSGTARTATLTDGGGNAIATLTCSNNETAPTFTTVSTDSDSVLPNGEQAEISATANFAAGEDLVVLLRYTTPRWVN